MKNAPLLLISALADARENASHGRDARDTKCGPPFCVRSQPPTASIGIRLQLRAVMNPRKANLYLNGKPVGVVTIKKTEAFFAFGDFQPNSEFSSFATLFGSWSLLIHDGESTGKMNQETAEELRLAEYEIDRLNAELRLLDSGEVIRISQLNIEGTSIEWRPVSR